MTKKKFNGDLAKRPAYTPEIRGLLKDMLQRRDNESRERENERLYKLLFGHYRLKLWDWQALACALAHDFVPAFAEPPKKMAGRRKRWTASAYRKLLEQFADQKRENPTREEAWICRYRLKKLPEYEAYTVGTLQARLSDARAWLVETNEYFAQYERAKWLIDGPLPPSAPSTET